MKKNRLFFYDFFKTVVILVSLIVISNSSFAGTPCNQKIENKCSREVWIAGVSQMNLQTQTAEQMVSKIIQIVNELAIYHPDIICLPEGFPTSNIKQTMSLKEIVEFSTKILPQFSDLAKKNNCYVICPIYTTENGKYYNSAVVFNREGTNIGEYRKIHLAIEEIEYGITPGPIDPPVFQADFGKFGIQICYDIYWTDGWQKLRDKGAEIVLWPSAFPAGQRVNAKACDNQYVVVSSTRDGNSRICDLRGEVIVQTGKWDKNYFCAPVNLEKVLVDTWPYYVHFNDIRKKYGRKILITTYHDEQWTVIESLSPDVHVADVLKEFKMNSFAQDLKIGENARVKAIRD